VKHESCLAKNKQSKDKKDEKSDKKEKDPISTISLYDNNGCEGLCDSCFCNKKVSFGAEFIYWKPYVNNLEYFAQRTVPPTGPVLFHYGTLDPDFEPGIHATLDIHSFLESWSLHLGFTYLEGCEERFGELTNGDTFVTPLLHTGLIEAGLPFLGPFDQRFVKWTSHYSEWEALFVKQFTNGCFKVLTGIGAAGLFLDQELDVSLTSSEELTSADVHWDNDLWGVGLRVSTEASYPICGCTLLFFDISGSLLAGDSDVKNLQTITFTPEGPVTLSVEFRDPHNTPLFIPGYHIRAGLAIPIPNETLCAHIKFGWEAVQWFNLPVPRRFMGGDLDLQGSQSTLPTSGSLGYHGLFVGAEVNF